MKASATSRTAQYMALFRAIETTRPAGSRLFSDPYAHSFLDTGLKIAVWLCKIPLFRNMVTGIIRKKIPGALSSGLARTRYIDDLLEKAVSGGAQQVIILGAGFDTRGLRLSFLNRMPVIEIDHPNTAAYKLARLQHYKIPAHIRYYQIDFNRQSLDQLGALHHFDYSIPTVVIWEGVTNYLSATAVDNTFAFLQRFAQGSYVIFTYVHQQLFQSPSSFTGGEKLLEDVAGLEEKWTFGMWPDALEEYLQRYGFSLQEDQGATEYRHQYLPDRTEEGYEFYRVAFAERTSG